MMFALIFAEGGGIQLVPDGTLFIHIAIILLMIFVLNRTMFKPINAILDKRDASLGGRSTEAHGILQSVDSKLSAYEQGLREARAQSYQMLERERAEAIDARQREIDAVRAEVTTAVDIERQNIESQATAARASLLSDARQIASEISSRVLRRPVTNLN